MLTAQNTLPVCSRFDQYADAWDTSVTLNVDGQEVRFFHCVDRHGVNRVWVDHNSFLSKVRVCSRTARRLCC